MRLEAKSSKIDVEKANGVSKASSVEPSQRRISGSLLAGVLRKEREKEVFCSVSFSFSFLGTLSPKFSHF